LRGLGHEASKHETKLAGIIMFIKVSSKLPEDYIYVLGKIDLGNGCFMTTSVFHETNGEFYGIDVRKHKDERVFLVVKTSIGKLDVTEWMEYPK